MRPSGMLSKTNVLRCNNLEVRVNFAKIIGNGNKIFGAMNVVLGSYNTVDGLGNTLIGLDNKQVIPLEPDKESKNGGASGNRQSGRGNNRKRSRAEHEADGEGEGGKEGEAEATAMDVVDLTSPPSAIRARRNRERRQRSQIESDHRMAAQLSREGGASNSQSLLPAALEFLGIFGATSRMDSMERDVLAMTSSNPSRILQRTFGSNPRSRTTASIFSSSSSSSSSSSPFGSGAKPLVPSAEQIAKEKDASAPEGAQEDDLCVICKDKPRTSMALPCQHVAFCASCGKDCVETHKIGKCPICRMDMSTGVIVREIWDEK